jgi:cold shock CspA family protein
LSTASAARRDGERVSDGPSRRERLATLVSQLYALVTGGHPRLAVNVARAPWLRDAETHALVPGTYSSEWHRAKIRTKDGVLEDRRFHPALLQAHLNGHYDVAVEAGAFVRALVFDLDLRKLPPTAAAEEVEAEQQRFWASFHALWALLSFGSAKLPILASSPNGGLHIYCPLDRPYPAQLVAAWGRYYVHRAGVKHVEVFPSGRPFRAPCGRGTALLVPRHPDEPNDLQLVACHVEDKEITNRRTGTRHVQRRRLVEPYLQAWLAAFDTTKRSLQAWLPEAPAWGDIWGPHGDRQGEAVSQHKEDFGGRGLPPSGPWISTESLPPSASLPAAEDGRPEQDGFLLRGAAYRRRVAALLHSGITEPGTRHDSVLKLTWYWASLGTPLPQILDNMEAWCRRFAHQCAYIHEHGFEKFVARARYDARSYYKSHCAELVARPQRDAVKLADLAEADRVMVRTAFEPELQDAAVLLLGFLGAHAATDGQVLQPVRLASSRMIGQLGGRRLADADGRQRRLYVVLLERCQELGILTLHRHHRAGSHAREYACWYRFGSGRLPARADTGELLLATRAVQEGTLAATSEGTPLEPARARLIEVSPLVPDRPRAWWRRMFARRWFTPLEFFASDEQRVLPLPRPTPVQNPPELVEGPPATLESLGHRTGVVLDFQYWRCFGSVTTDQAEVAFIHQTDIDHRGFRDLVAGESVEFDLVRTTKGLRATSLRRHDPRPAGASWRVAPPLPRERVAVPAEGPATPSWSANDPRPGSVPPHPAAPAARRHPRDTEDMATLRQRVKEAETQGDAQGAREALGQLLQLARSLVRGVSPS